MATNPYFTQYHTQRFSFIGSPQQRDGSYIKDQRFLNMYPELIKSPISDGKKYYLKKRPGVSAYQSLPTGLSQGMFYWNDAYYYAINGFLYQNSNPTPILALTQNTTDVGFCEYRTDSVDQLFICDGFNAWLLNPNNTFTFISTIPKVHLPYPIFLDGYIFVALANNQNIFNSALQDPTTWPSDGFIDAEMYPDNVVALTKAQNYLVAIGSESVEFFYDNANATGSPLQRNAPAVSQFGCPAPATINQTEKEVILVGQTGNGGRTCWVISGFQPTEIANEPVREALDAESDQIGIANAFTIQISGHKFYVLNLRLSSRTFVYDFEEQMWHEWSSGLLQNLFPYRYAADGNAGYPVLLGYNGGQSVALSPNNYTDLGNPIDCVVTTSKIDFDTIMRKRIFRLSLITDSPNGDTSVPMTVDWSDDDYNTWVGNRTLSIGPLYPTITQLGYTRRRAFRFTYQQPYPLRMEAFEVDIVQEVRR
jgi:hypothetical protein